MNTKNKQEEIWHNMEKDIIKIAKMHGWHLHDHQKLNFLLIFRRDKEQVNVWYTKMTVATVVDHPKKGRQQLYRKHVSLTELNKIFQKPRQHTGKGYRLRKSVQSIVSKFFNITAEKTIDK